LKFLLSPIGLIVIVAILVILFLPRRAPDKLKKFGKPMRAFDDEPKDAASGDSPKREHAPSSGAAHADGSSSADQNKPAGRA
jgi:Sec-independent protein translocase protein TatA